MGTSFRFETPSSDRSIGQWWTQEGKPNLIRVYGKFNITEAISTVIILTVIIYLLRVKSSQSVTLRHLAIKQLKNLAGMNRYFSEN
jgi:hypothetical protein